MAIIRCIKEHAYDDKVYASCPICNDLNVFVKNSPNSFRMPFEYLNDGYILKSRYIIEKVFQEDFMCITYLALDNQSNTRVLIDELYPLKIVFRNCYDTSNVSRVGNEGARQFNIAFALMTKDYSSQRFNFVSSPIGCINENNTIYLIYEYSQWPSLEEFLSKKKDELTADEIVTMVENFVKELIKMHQEKKFHGNITTKKALISASNSILLSRIAYTRIKFIKELNWAAVPFQDNMTIDMINSYIKERLSASTSNGKLKDTSISEIGCFGIDEKYDVLAFAVFIKMLCEAGVHKGKDGVIFKKDGERKKKALEFIDNYFILDLENCSISDFYTKIKIILCTPAIPVSSVTGNNATSINIDQEIIGIEKKIKNKKTAIWLGIVLTIAIIFIILSGR